MRHEFQPGRLIAGVVQLVAGVLFALDARDRLAVSVWVLLPLVAGGLALAALAGTVAYIVRRGDRAEPTGNRDRG
ncbi:hypothetical protein [Streptomyces sp. NRRL S-87]|uniref:hypothetical protein n=1 Tax=Streptomyces sp. NRRL S-87 TaxID=1463920 RepID=UPI0004C1C78C|nr:hypothetical protein [Streptomyces sp. NRRL S-87]